MIEVTNLVKRYGDHTAVDHLSFHIEKGPFSVSVQRLSLQFCKTGGE